MGNSEHLTSIYRLVASDGSVVDVRDLPTDGEALAWAEDVRRHRTPKVFIRRVERQTSDEWILVPAAGETPFDE